MIIDSYYSCMYVCQCFYHRLIDFCQSLQLLTIFTLLMPKKKKYYSPGILSLIMVVPVQSTALFLIVAVVQLSQIKQQWLVLIYSWQLMLLCAISELVIFCVIKMASIALLKLQLDWKVIKFPNIATQQACRNMYYCIYMPSDYDPPRLGYRMSV